MERDTILPYTFIAIWIQFVTFMPWIRAIRPSVTLLSVPFDTRSNLTDLTLIGLLPFTGEAWPSGDAMLPPMRWAVEDIGRRNDILQGYRLNVHIMDSKVGL